jgi:hypothetical protein
MSLVRRICLAGTLAAGATLASAAAPAATYDVTLSGASRAALVIAACASVGVTQIDTLRAWVHDRNSKDINADVKCRAHGADATNPEIHYATCESHDNGWKCAQGYNAVLVKATQGPDLSLVPNGVAIRTVLDLLPEIAKLHNRFGTSAMAYLYGLCTVDRSIPFKGGEQFDFACEGHKRVVTLTRDCGSKPCRTYLVDARGETA